MKRARAMLGSSSQNRHGAGIIAIFCGGGSREPHQAWQASIADTRAAAVTRHSSAR